MRWWIIRGQRDGDDEPTTLVLQAKNEDALRDKFERRLGRGMYDTWVNLIVQCGQTRPKITFNEE